jgi:dTDP-glucose 4,6-dehydratase
MRHVIIGGSGFTGAVLARALAPSADEIVNFDLAPTPADLADRCRFVEGDVRRPEDLARIGLGPDDMVYHLAARQFHLAVPHKNQDAWFAEVNVAGTKAVLDAMTAGGARRLVFLSTDMVYGRPDQVPVPVTHPRRPLGPYGRSKFQAEDLIGAWRAAGGQATVFRPRMISGPGRLGVLEKLFVLIDLGLPAPMIGAGRNRYQMIAVQDCVDAMLAAVAQGLPPGPFNLGSNDPPLVRDLMRALVRHAGSRSMVVPTPGGLVKAVLAALDSAGIPLLHPEQFLIADQNYIVDTSATEATLGWRPKRSDQDMLMGAYDAYRASRAKA